MGVVYRVLGVLFSSPRWRLEAWAGEFWMLVGDGTFFVTWVFGGGCVVGICGGELGREVAYYLGFVVFNLCLLGEVLTYT